MARGLVVGMDLRPPCLIPSEVAHTCRKLRPGLSVLYRIALAPELVYASRLLALEKGFAAGTSSAIQGRQTKKRQPDGCLFRTPRLRSGQLAQLLDRGELRHGLRQ